MSTASLTPFQLAEYFRDHVPHKTRAGVRGYVLRILIDMVRLKGENVGACWPSVEYLAKMVGRSGRHVQRIMRELETLGEVERIPRRNANGGWSSNTYRLKGLISWAAKNVTRGGDTRSTKTPSGRIKTPARGVKSGFRKKQTAHSTPYSSRTAPMAATGQGLEKSGPVGTFSAQRLSTTLNGRTTASPARREPLTAVQIEEARARCHAARWAQLLIDAAADGATGDDLAEGAARRWRARAIVDRIDLTT